MDSQVDIQNNIDATDNHRQSHSVNTVGRAMPHIYDYGPTSEYVYTDNG